MHGVVQNNNLICYVCASNCILLRTFVLRFILSPACVHCVGVSSYVVCLHVTCYCRSNKQAFDARDNLKRLMEQMKIELTTSHGDSVAIRKVIKNATLILNHCAGYFCNATAMLCRLYRTVKHRQVTHIVHL